MTKHIDLAQVESLAASGLTNEQIALALGISRSNHFQRKKENKDYLDAIKRGEAKGVAKVANALFQNAMSGNTTAQIFYLKNRSCESWSDRVENHMTGDGSVLPTKVQLVARIDSSDD